MRSFLNLLLFLVLLSGFSCDSDEETCANPILDKIDGKKVYYYENGLLAEYTWSINTLKFSYTQSGLLVQVVLESKNIQALDALKIFYTEDGKLSYAERYNQNGRVDSTHVTLDAEQRITKLTQYANSNTEEPVMLYLQTIEYEYEGFNSTYSKITRYDGYEQGMLIEYDDKPIPFPSEIQYAQLLYTPYYWNVNNVTKITYQFEEGGNVQEIKLKYNAAGHLTSLTNLGVTTRFSYACNQRKIEDQ